MRGEQRVLSSTERLNPPPDDPVIENGTLTKYDVFLKNYFSKCISMS